MCQVDNTDDGTPWWLNPQNLIIRKRGLKESKTNGFYTIETQDGSTTTYEVNVYISFIFKLRRYANRDINYLLQFLPMLFSRYICLQESW